MLTAEFFEGYPLYRKFKVQLSDDYQKIGLPAIHLFCPTCQSRNTFVGGISIVGVRHRNQLSPPQSPNIIAGRSGFVQYYCTSCNDYRQFFLLYFGEDLSYVMKTGQYPSWSISIEENLSEILGEYEETYRKGLVCESQGYGIGAYAYYRRIVESIIDRLLDSIHDLLEENDNDKAAYEQAIREAQQDIG